MEDEVKDTEKNKDKGKGREGNKPFKNGKNGRGSKPNKKPSGYDDRRKGKYTTNDSTWYALSEAILRDSASLPFSNPVGSQIAEMASSALAQSIPGICILHMEPALGNSRFNGNALQKAALKYYAFIRQANSGAKNYEAPDLLMYLLGVTTVYELCAEFQRIYGLRKQFSNYNLYIGKAVCEALGYDYESFVGNAADIRARFNSLISFVNKSFHIPKGLKILERRIFCNSSIFVDHPGSKFQMYAYRMDHYLQFTGTDYVTGSALVGKTIRELAGNATGTYITASNLLDAIENLLVKLAADEDIQIMSGDILKAYGNNVVEMGELDAEWSTPVVYDVPVLGQIHNAHINFYPTTSNASTVQFYVESGVVSTTSGASVLDYPVVYQKDGEIRSIPVTQDTISGVDGLVGFGNLNILDIPVEQPTPADVMECTRLQCIADRNDELQIDPSAAPVYSIICGSEVFKSLEVFVNNSGDGSMGYLTPIMLYTTDKYFSSSTAAAVGKLKNAAVLSNFDWAPLLQSASESQSTIPAENGKCTGLIGDISNYTVPGVEFYRNIHRSAILGLLDIPILEVRR